MKATIVLLLAFASFGTLAQTVDICDRTPQVREAILEAVGTDDCAAVNSATLERVDTFSLASKGLTALQAGDFKYLWGLRRLRLNDNELTTLPVGVFDGLNGIYELSLERNRLTTLPPGVFDGLRVLEGLRLNDNELTSLPVGVFDGLAKLGELWMHRNELTTLPVGVFDGLFSLHELRLERNLLTTLPPGVFDGLTRLQRLTLNGNHLVGLLRDDPLFAAFSSRVDIQLHDQTTADGRTRTDAAVPLMLSASTSGRQGFVRIVNEGDESGIVRVFAVDDGGNAMEPFQLELGARQVVQFNSNDLENGNANKGIENGVGNPVQGDWRLDVETSLPVRVMAFVRHADGFLTAMHDVLPRTDDGRRVAYTFNPGRNADQASKLRLVNTGGNDAPVSIEGVDDGGNTAGPVTLTLAAGESRTLSAVDLESGTHELSGTLGTGAGKWRLFVTARRSVVGMALLQSASGHLTNISTSGVAPGG